MERVDPATRYSRQILFGGIGEEGQARLRGATAVVVGCGALGSFSASLLARAGVGRLRLIDRDVVEESNLQRQILFTESDIRDLKPKAIAARDHLAAADSSIALEAVVADLGPDNAVSLLAGAGVVVDGTDNFEARFLVNDVSIRHGIPWIYGACLGAYGVTMTIVPGETACLRCLMEEAPPPGTVPTCDTVGVIGPIVGAIASIQAAEALKILSGKGEAIRSDLLSLDLWTGGVSRVEVPRGGGRRRCPACDGLELEYLSGKGARPAVLCGRNAVQVTPEGRAPIDLDGLARRLGGAGRVELSPFLVRFTAPGCEMTIFPDGRAIVAGTRDPSAARALYARYVGA